MKDNYKRDPLCLTILSTRQPKIAYKVDTSNNLLPIARRSNGDCQIGSSPGSGSSLLQTFPEFTFQWHILEVAHQYSGGTAPAFYRTSLLSPWRAPISFYSIFK